MHIGFIFYILAAIIKKIKNNKVEFIHDKNVVAMIAVVIGMFVISVFYNMISYDSIGGSMIFWLYFGFLYFYLNEYTKEKIDWDNRKRRKL